MKIIQFFLYTAILIFSLQGCTVIKPVNMENETTDESHTFSHASFDRVLERFVDDNGYVNYSSLKEAPHDLEYYYSLIAKYSPDRYPELFPTTKHKLAYWINAYNATVIKTILHYYPISSVLDVKPPAIFFLLSDKSGFFVFQRLYFGGKTTNLYYLENSIIRKRFSDPRIHFALNCAALSCPHLPTQSFDPFRLEHQLDKETRRFLAEKRNFKIKHPEKKIYLSTIFKWYENDFLKWFRKRFPERDATVLNYIALFLSREKAAELTQAAGTYQVDYTPYNWRLNDKKNT